MSIYERAMWISIYLECWPNGSVPADPGELAKYLGYPVEDVKTGLTERVLSFFKEVKGELISPQLEEYHEKQIKRRKKQSEGGKKGANRRYNKELNDEGKSIGQPMGQPIGSLNTIKSNTLKSNQIQSLEKEVINDPWLDDYDAASEEERMIKVQI